MHINSTVIVVPSEVLPAGACHIKPEISPPYTCIAAAYRYTALTQFHGSAITGLKAAGPAIHTFQWK